MTVMKSKNVYPLVFFLTFSIVCGCSFPTQASEQQKTIGPSTQRTAEAKLGYIDVHNHLFGGPHFHPDFPAAARVALSDMDELGIQKMIIMPPPFVAGHRGNFDINDLTPLAREFPDRLAVMGGGGSLNIMIQSARDPESVTPELRARFEKTAEDILTKGAVGFGELAVEHFSFKYEHPYESVSAVHPLFLLLADLAANFQVPLDIHMEAVPQDMPLPDRPLLKRSGNNPKIIKGNLSAFEQLLAHNRRAKIIWAHVGWCNTGFRTPSLCRELLRKHPNLYMSFKLSPESLADNRPVSEDRKRIKPEWLDLIREFPDRFLVGADHFFVPPGSPAIGPQKAGAIRHFLSLLPPDLARQVGIENPIRLFNLKR